MDEIKADGRGLKRLSAHLDESADKALRDIRAVVTRGALNIKKDAQKRVGRGGYVGAYPTTIGYDTQILADGMWAQIGPDKDRQAGGGKHRTPGNLGVLLEYEYGTPWSAPKPHLGPALLAEAPRFEKALEDAVVKALGL